MKFCFILLVIFLSVSSYANECLSVGESKFSAEQIDKNPVTLKYQIYKPFFKLRNGTEVYIHTLSGDANAHFCKFYGLSGGRLKRETDNCDNKSILQISSDGSYYIEENRGTGICISMFECEQ